MEEYADSLTEQVIELSMELAQLKINMKNEIA